MSKIIISPVPRWPGTVVLADPLTFPQVIAIEKAYDAVRELGEQASVAEQHAVLLPALFPCIEKWELASIPENVTIERGFPATPRREASLLVAWLIEEITKLFIEAEEVPND